MRPQRYPDSATSTDAQNSAAPNTPGTTLRRARNPAGTRHQAPGTALQGTLHQSTAPSSGTACARRPEQHTRNSGISTTKTPALHKHPEHWTTPSTWNSALGTGLHMAHRYTKTPLHQLHQAPGTALNRARRAPHHAHAVRPLCGAETFLACVSVGGARVLSGDRLLSGCDQVCCRGWRLQFLSGLQLVVWLPDHFQPGA